MEREHTGKGEGQRKKMRNQRVLLLNWKSRKKASEKGGIGRELGKRGRRGTWIVKVRRELSE